MVLHGRFRQFWKSWLALGLLVAVAGGFVLIAASAGHRTADAFPRFAAQHGYDAIVYSEQPLPQLSGLPDVSSVTPVSAASSADVGCASCRQPIDAANFLVNEVSPGQLTRMVTLLSGRMPRPSDPGEVLASFTLAQENGVRVGSVLRPLLRTREQPEGGTSKPDPALRPALRVVGIAAAESEFPSGTSPHYDLYATPAFATAFNHRVALLQTSYMRLAHGDADLAGLDGRLRPLGVGGTADLDQAADAVQASIRPQVIGWYGLAGLAALAALAVIGQAMARQTLAERADQQALAVLGVRPREFAGLALLRALLTGTAGAAGAVLIAVLASPLTPVGEARLAVPAPGRMSFDVVIVLPGALAVLAAVIAVSAWPALRQARLLTHRPPWQPARRRTRPGRAAGRDGPARHGDGGDGAVRDRRLRGQPGPSHVDARPVRRAVPGLLRQ
jgi:hypothetical protein